MKYYTIREEYLPLWTNDTTVTTETIVNGKELSRLSREWGRDEDELELQLNEISPAAMTDSQLAEAIRTCDEWDSETLCELCERAGLSLEWSEADGDSFESVVNRAAEILEIEI